MTKPKLTAKQAAFVLEYLVDLNAAHAAIRAGYSPRSAKVTGCRLLTNANVAAEIQKAKAERIERCEIDGDKVLALNYAVATADIRDIFDEAGRLLPPGQWPDRVAFAISGVEFKTNQLGQGEIEHVAKIKLSERAKWVDMLHRHLGHYEQDNEQRRAEIHLQEIKQDADEFTSLILRLTAGARADQAPGKPH